MMTKLITIAMLIIAVLISGCSRGPEDAKSDLTKMNIQYNAESFLDSIVNNNQKAVSLFLEAGMSPSVSTDSGNPLLLAALSANLETAKLLVEKGANVNEKHKNGMSPLMGAILCETKGVNQQNVIKFLIEKGADVNAPYVLKGVGHSPLKMATALNDTEVVKLLKNAGAK